MTGLISLLLRPSGSPSRHHLADDCLLRIVLTPNTERPNEAETSHLLICAQCSDRLTDMSTTLTKLPDEVEANFQAVFTPERLQHQSRQIIRRLAQKPPRMYLAPTLRFSARWFLPKLFSLCPKSVWLTAPAAGVVLFGLFGSQSFYFATAPPPSHLTHVSALNHSAAPAQPSPTVGGTGTMNLQSAPVTFSGHHLQISLEEFELIIAEYESAGGFSHPSTTGQITEFASIDALTPNVRDATHNSR